MLFNVTSETYILDMMVNERTEFGFLFKEKKSTMENNGRLFISNNTLMLIKKPIHNRMPIYDGFLGLSPGSHFMNGIQSLKNLEKIFSISFDEDQNSAIKFGSYDPDAVMDGEMFSMLTTEP